MAVILDDPWRASLIVDAPRSKGLRERIVVARHGLRNALGPLVTFLGLLAPVLVGGTVIIETIFNLPGMGFLLVDSIIDRDYTVVSGVMLYFGVVVMLINLVVDLSCAWLDPRVRQN